MAAYVAGDAAGLAELFRRHAPGLAAVLRRQVGGEDARDLVQQTFLNLHRARRDFRSGARLRPWLYTIAFNLARDRRRRWARKPELSVAPDQQDRTTGLEPDVEGLARDRAVQAALAALGEAQREVIVLHWYGGFSFEEIGRLVGATTSAVKVRAHRGYEKLREQLGALRVTVPGGPS